MTSRITTYESFVANIPSQIYACSVRQAEPGQVGTAMGQHSGADEVGHPQDRQAAAAYVAELSADLATIARRHGLVALGYILDMARLEAENATRHVGGRR